MLTRRSFLASGVAAGTGLAASSALARTIDRALAVPAPRHASLQDVEHVVVLMQENRSFDHYFGTLRGVRGFGDPNIITTGGRPAWNQLDPDLTDNPQGYVLPFRLDTTKTSGQGVADQSHAWSAQHASWNGGTMDGFVAAHRVGNGGGASTGALCMGYYERKDIPFHYKLADAFTVCDAYHCSVLGPTNPNRVMAMSGTVDPAGMRGGPVLDNSQTNGQLLWTSYPERLEAAGVSWFVYQEADNDGNNMLPFFAGVNAAPPGSSLARRANTIIPTPKGAKPGPALAAQLRSDVVSGNLPQVSWILAGTNQCEHPTATPGAGAKFIAGVLDALTADPAVWAKTVLFLTYDENDGFFDHVPPVTAARGTPGEYVNQITATKNFAATLGIPGPVGLGFRVPMLVISPFSRGGMVSSDSFDHTSTIRFLEQRFGVKEPNISAWRRGVVGDLTSALGCLSTPNLTVPALPDAARLAQEAAAQVRELPAPTIPAVQSMATQEPGTRPQAGAGCAPSATRSATSTASP